MRHKFLVLTVKKLLKSTYIYGSYRKIKTGLSLFWTTRYIGAVIFAIARHHAADAVATNLLE